jgi:hypothetical protein
MSMLPDLQRWCPNHWLNLQLTKVDLWIWTKRTPQQNEKLHNAVTRERPTQRRTRWQTHKYKRKQIKGKLCENHLFKLKEEEEEEKMQMGDFRPKMT